MTKSKQETEKQEAAQEQPEQAAPQEQPANERSKVAARLAAGVAPVMAKAIMGGQVSFAALTVIVDDKHSFTFPYYPMVSKDAPNEEIYEARLTHAKINMLSAVEFAKTAALFKQRAIKSLEEGYLDPPPEQ